MPPQDFDESIMIVELTKLNTHMKQLLIVISLMITCANYASANLLTVIREVQGPVKKMVITCNQAGTLRTWVFHYDSIGRLTEFALLHDGKIEEGYVRQYTINNVYVDYYYNANGIIKGNYRYVQTDSLDHVLYSKYYKEGILFSSDSTIYNEKRLEIEHYVKNDKEFVLQYSCEYDSIGRLIKRFNNWRGDELTWTFEYLSNGDYIEHFSDIRGRKSDKKYIHNESGQLVEIKGKEEHSRFTKFDQYGNWTLWRAIHKWPIGKYEYIYKRTIEYYH